MNTTNSAGVLAVLDRQAELARRTGSSEDLLNLHKARAAVAELIEACKARDAAVKRGENIEWTGVGARYRAALAALAGNTEPQP